MEIEEQILRIVALDRTDVPISSLSGKIKRRKPKWAKEVDFNEKLSFIGKRVYARIVEEETMKARGMKEGIELFKEKYPRQGMILQGYIEEQRKVPETNFYFGINEGCRLTEDDYVGVLIDLGFTEASAKKFYPELIEISRKIVRKREEHNRSILIG